ncbi:rCG48905 [Rattus norvegicus]|uniref:RCG48905 n=1 Tax=Rattus norvegicus TaxID=10116 RepID=A6IGI4_RAT|nr:rCG48905 [Rattus norvegicus]
MPSTCARFYSSETNLTVTSIQKTILNAKIKDFF